MWLPLIMYKCLELFAVYGNSTFFNYTKEVSLITHVYMRNLCDVTLLCTLFNTAVFSVRTKETKVNIATCFTISCTYWV